MIDTWRALEFLYEAGKVRAIGISNFSIYHIDYLLANARIKPMVHQLEFHPQHQNKEVIAYSKKHGMFVEAWGALNQGRIFKVPCFQEIADKYKKTAAQVAIRYSLQKDCVPIIRSSNIERIQKNFNVWDFEISKEDMNLLDSLDGGEFSGWHTDSLRPVPKISLEELSKVLPKECKVSVYKIFNFIPILKVKYKKNKNKFYLFGFIPFLWCKKKFK